MSFPDYPKDVLRAGRDAPSWPRPENAPGRYEFDSEMAHATHLNDVRFHGVTKYAAENNINQAVALAILEEQVIFAEQIVRACQREVWGE